ncbi:hypothetical protein ACNKF0_09890 [Nocardioides sp. T5]|uniref:hypothetical protein n=1 Tax=Nocardioides sp. T5 TaxID=3400182 RepID=UPI003A8C6A66
MVDPAPEFLELLPIEVRLVERDLFRLSSVWRNGQIDVQRLDQRPDEVNDGLQDIGRRLGEGSILLGLKVGLRDRVVIVDVIVLDQVLVERLGKRFLDDRFAIRGVDRLASEEFGLF